MRDLIKSYAAAGLQMFAPQPGLKEPMGKWKDQATTDPEAVMEALGQGELYPVRCAEHGMIDLPRNLGVFCQGSGLVAIDIDSRNGGFDTVKAMMAKKMVFPKPPMARTGQGGMHVYLRAPSGRLVGKIGDGIDVKHNGYTVMPPSILVKRLQGDFSGARLSVHSADALQFDFTQQRLRDRPHPNRRMCHNRNACGQRGQREYRRRIPLQLRQDHRAGNEQAGNQRGRQRER